MKFIISWRTYFFIAIAACLLFNSACSDDKCEYTYYGYAPIYKSYEEFRLPISATEARELKKPGKIYYKTPYLFISEQNEGVHIFDNSNPQNPQNLAFIAISGNSDIAIKNNTLYADNYTDLLAINIDNPKQPVLSKRLENVFNQQYPTGEEGVIIGYEDELSPISYTYDCDQEWIICGDMQTFESATAANGSSEVQNSPQTQGIGGSMARFTIPPGGNHLYIATINELKTFDLNDTANPIQKQDIYLGWNIETIYPFNNKLMIGSMSGMFIYDISNPESPKYISTFAHATQCDPVVAAGNYAYVTLRDGTECQGFGNELNVVSIADIYNPSLVKSYPMTHPLGLGIDNNTLFICDDEDGLKIYDATDVSNIASNQLAHYENVNATDVIPFNDVLMMIGNDGLYQYDYSNINNITLLSKIPISQ